jgi:hypothetical protein
VLGQRLREAEFGNYVFLVNMTVDEKKKKKKRNSKIITSVPHHSLFY